MALWDTFLINGTDIASLARIVEQWDGARQAGARRGANLTLPGVAGEVFVPKVRAVPTVTLGLALLACDPTTGVTPAAEADQVAQFNANLRSLLRLVDASTTVPLTVTRRMSLPGGATESHEAQAELGAPMAPTLLAGARAARLTLELRILDGVWYAAGDSTASVTAGATTTVTSAGDTRTNRITATFSAGPSVLTNTTNGTSLAVTHPGDTVVQELWSYWGVASGSFALDRGANAVTVDTGSVVLTYREAYL